MFFIPPQEFFLCPIFMDIMFKEMFQKMVINGIKHTKKTAIGMSVSRQNNFQSLFRPFVVWLSVPLIQNFNYDSTVLYGHKKKRGKKQLKKECYTQRKKQL